MLNQTHSKSPIYQATQRYLSNIECRDKCTVSAPARNGFKLVLTERFEFEVKFDWTPPKRPCSRLFEHGRFAFYARDAATWKDGKIEPANNIRTEVYVPTVIWLE